MQCRAPTVAATSTNADVNTAGARRLIICSAHVNAELEPGATITVRYPSFDGAAVSTANQFSGLDPSAPAGPAAVAHQRQRRRQLRHDRTDQTSHGTRLRCRSTYDGSSTFRAGTGYLPIGAVTFGNGTARLSIDPEFRIVSASGAFTFAGTLSSPQPWRAAIVTFFAA